jgi:hypothetical protein
VSSSLAHSAPARGGRRPAIQAHAARGVLEAARASVLPRVAALEAAAARLAAREGAGLAAVAVQLRRILTPLAELRAPEPQPAAGAAHGAVGASCPAAGAAGAVCGSGAHGGPASCLALEASGGPAGPVGGSANEQSEGCSGVEESPQLVSSCGRRLSGIADACAPWDGGAGEGSVCAHVSADAPPALSPAGSALLGAPSLDARRPNWTAGADDQAAGTAAADASGVGPGLTVSCASEAGALCHDVTLVPPPCRSPDLPRACGAASAPACPPPCAAGGSACAAAAGHVSAAGDAGGEPPPATDGLSAGGCSKEGAGGGADKAAGGVALFLQGRGWLSTGESAPGRIGVGSPAAAAGAPPLARAGASGASWGSGAAESLAAAGSGGGSEGGSPASARSAGAPGEPRALGSCAAGEALDDSCPVFAPQVASGWPSGMGECGEPITDPDLLSSCAASPWVAAGVHPAVQDAQEWPAGAQHTPSPDPLRDLASARRAWAALVTQLSLRPRGGPLTLTLAPGGAEWGAAPGVAATLSTEPAGRPPTAAAVEAAADAAAAAGAARGPGLLAAVSALLQRARLAEDAAACVRGCAPPALARRLAPAPCCPLWRADGMPTGLLAARAHGNMRDVLRMPAPPHVGPAPPSPMHPVDSTAWRCRGRRLVFRPGRSRPLRARGRSAPGAQHRVG